MPDLSFFSGILRKYSLYGFLALFVAIALQLQFSFFKHGDYLGLRLNAADMLLPFIGLLILTRLALKKDFWPQWRVPYFYAGLGTLSIVMTIALFHGYQTTGVWHTWAIFNKYIGWFVLIGYLGFGGWIGSRPLHDYMPALQMGLLGFWAFTLIFVMGRLMLIDLQGNTHQILLNYPLAGFMGNRNAYAFLSFSMLAMMTAWQWKSPEKTSWGFYAIWALIPVFYAYNASRAGLVILIFIFLAFMIVDFKFVLRHIIPAFAAGIIFTLVFFSSFNSYAIQITHGNVESSRQLMMLEGFSAAEAEDKLDYVGDKVRMDTYGDAVELWLKYPLIGGGLGSFRDYQTNKRGSVRDIIDCTGLWLLAETGAIGFGLFSAFFLMALWQLFLKVKRAEDDTGFYLSILLVMMIFAIMSLVHELIYTRFLWFLMGIGLSLPLTSCAIKTRQGE